MSFRSHSHVKSSMILTIADYLFIPNYIRSLQQFILRSIGIYIYIWLEPVSCRQYRTYIEPTDCVYTL